MRPILLHEPVTMLIVMEDLGMMGTLRVSKRFLEMIDISDPVSMNALLVVLPMVTVTKNNPNTGRPPRFPRPCELQVEDRVASA